MKHVFTALVVLIVFSSGVTAQSVTAKRNQTVEQEITDLEKKWSTDIQRQDPAVMEQYLASGYFLAVGREGHPLEIVPRKNWLDNLRNYKLESFNIDEIKVSVYDKTAIALMLFTQKATVGRGRRDGQLLITDIWVKEKNGWRVAERHSVRLEQPPAVKPS
jgi:hypothetical protein